MSPNEGRNRRSAGLRAALLVSLGHATVPALSVPPGDYTGWAYMHGGGDFPVQWRLGGAPQDPQVLLHLPHLKTFGLPVVGTVVTDHTIAFRRQSDQGGTWDFQGSADGDVITGRATLLDGDEELSFELHRSAEPVDASVLPDRAGYLGTYVGPQGRTIVVNAWFWGELRFFDTLTGRTGTLFRSPKGDFFAGPAEYVPAPVYARFRFERSAAGVISTLTWSASDGPAQRLNRTPTTEKSVQFSSGDARLRGTLVRPAGDGPFPLVVVLGGSGWRTRDAVRREADIFASMGIAALTYDKRGHEQSTGDAVCTFSQTADDVCAAVRAMRQRAEIDARRIGVFGVSRGGWFAPLAVANCDGISFVVVFVAPAVSPARQETTRRLNEMRTAGFPDTDIAEARAFLDLLWKSTESDDDWDRYATEQARLADRAWFPIVGETESRDSDGYRWQKLNMRYDPVPTLQRVTCPLLALFGERDMNVTPDDNVPRMREALERAGNDDFTLKVLPRADHGLRPVEPGRANTPLHRATGYVQDVWPTVRAWLAERSILDPTPDKQAAHEVGVR